MAKYVKKIFAVMQKGEWMSDSISRHGVSAWLDNLGHRKLADVIMNEDRFPSAKPVKAYTKADYIMALHKEYGCTLTMAEEAHNKALEHLRSKARMKG